MENAIEVRYAGVVVGRGALVRDLGDDGAFVGIAEPMPVGTTVSLKIGDAVREGHVDEVVESADPGAVGMRVRWGGVATAAAPPRPVASSAGAATSPPATDASAPSVAAAPDAGVAPAAEVDDASGSISAPLSLAAPSGDGSHQGGGKRRRKRR